ncbi:MAG: translocation/assembly module TamB domain-containing protein, partial [Bacillota bacterium]
GVEVSTSTERLVTLEELVVKSNLWQLILSNKEVVASLSRVEVNGLELEIDSKLQQTMESNNQFKSQDKELLEEFSGQVVINNSKIKSNYLSDGSGVKINKGVIDYSGQQLVGNGKLELLSSSDSASGSVEVAVQSNLDDFELDLQLDEIQLDQFSTAISKQLLPTELKVSRGKVSGEVKLAGNLNNIALTELDCNAQLTVAKVVATHQDLPLKLRINESKLTLKKQQLLINRLVGQLGSTPLEAQGVVRNLTNPNFYVRYQTSQLPLEVSQKWLPSDLKLTGAAEVRGEVRGSKDRLSTTAKVVVANGKFNDVAVNDLEFDLWYNDGLVSFSNLEAKVASGSLEGRGTITLPPYHDKLYTASLELNELDLAKLSRISDQLALSGQADGNLVISGQETADSLSLFGDAQISNGQLYGCKFDELSSNLWYANQQLLVSDLMMETAEGSWQVQGIVDEQRDLDLSIKGEGIKLAQLDQLHNYQDLTGTLELEGNLTGNLVDPIFTGGVKLTDIEYLDYQFEELEGLVTYQKQEIDLQELTFSQGASRYYADGQIKLQDQMKVDLNLETEAGRIEDLYKLMGNQQLAEISGQIAGQINLTGALNDLTASGELQLLEGEFRGLTLDSGQAIFDWYDDQLQLNKLEINGEQLAITAKGQVNQKGQLDLAVAADKVNLTRLDLLEGQADGRLDFTGSITGEITEPIVSGEFVINNPAIEDYDFNSSQGQITYNHQQQLLQLQETVIKKDETEYQVSGGLDLAAGRFKSFKLDVFNGYLQEVIELLPVKNHDYTIHHDFYGQLELDGLFTQPQVAGEVVVKDIDQSGFLAINGTYDFQSGADLSLQIYDFTVAPFNKLLPNKTELGGDLTADVQLNGQFPQLRIQSNLELKDGRIGSLDYQSLSGKIVWTKQGLFKVVEPLQLQINQDNLAVLTGELPLELDNHHQQRLHLTLEQGNLNLLTDWWEEVQSARGNLDFDLTIGGSITAPQFSGQSSLSAGRLKLPVLKEDITNAKGRLEFTNQELKLEKLSGQQGQGGFKAAGRMEIDDWQLGRVDLDVDGRKISLDHGSWQGKNDFAIKVTGAAKSPLVNGEIKVYDTEIGIPFDLPMSTTSETNQDWSPQFDLNLRPHSNVRVVNDNLNILVESGQVNLVSTDQGLALAGQLESSSGSFGYYNTNFELESATAVFDRYEGLIPYLNLTAHTTVNRSQINRSVSETQSTESEDTATQDGSSSTSETETLTQEADLFAKEVEVTLQLSGLADQMQINLQSNPALSQEQIIMLLANDGGLSGLLEGEYEQLIRTELLRVFESNLDLKFFSNIEETLKDKWDLDRFKIYTGFRGDWRIELGKNVSERLTLNYKQQFAEEDVQSLGFEYRIWDLLGSVILDGTINNDEEYQLKLKSNFSF